MSNGDTTVFDAMEALEKRTAPAHQERDGKQPAYEQLPTGNDVATKQFVHDMLGIAADEVFGLLADDFRALKKKFAEESLEMLQRIISLTKEMEAQRTTLQNITREVFGNVESLPKFIDTKRDVLQ